jgi:hypothetical protein
LGLVPPGTSRLWSPELRVALAPAATYRLLLEERTRASWGLLVRPAMFLLALGTAVSIMLTRRPTLDVIALSAVFWSFVVVVQLVAGAVVIASAPARQVGLLRGLDLWFAGHLPYSLWLLIVAAMVEISGKSSPVIFLLSALIPAAWTMVIAAAFCRTVLATTRAGARWRMALHQAAILCVAAVYVLWAAGGAASVTSFLGRQVAQQ